MGKKVKKQTPAIPQNIAESIPYFRVYENGILEIEPNYFSKSYRLGSVNFKIAKQTKQNEIAVQYGEFLSAFDSSALVEITCYNKTVDINKFQEDTLLAMQADKLNHYREEYNEMLLSNMTGAKNNLDTEKLLTVTIPAISIDEATTKFSQIDLMVKENVAKITKHEPDTLSTIERLEILNSIYNQDSTEPLYRKRTIQGHEVESFTLKNCANQGITTKDAIAPDGLEFANNYFKVGNTYGKSYYISNYPTWIKGTILTDLAGIPCNMLVSTYFNSIEPDEAIKLIKRQNTNIAASIIEKQKKASRSGIDSNLISPDLQDAKEETADLMDQITKDNEKLFTTTMVITLFAPTMEDLESLEGQLKMIGNRNLITIRGLNMQQEQGFNSSLPIGNNQLPIERLMTTTTVSALIPFDVTEVRKKGGMYYGLNASSKSMILYNRTDDINMNACILGMPGGGKSFAAKREMINVLLSTGDEVYVIDPEREYVKLAEALGGSVIKLANGSNKYCNPFDMNLDNADDDGDPVKVKCDFISSLCETMVGNKYGLSPIEKSMIDRCVIKVYEPYVDYLEKTGKRISTEKAPTMHDFYNELLLQPQVEAQNLAFAIERYVTGSLDIFSHRTNVEIDNRFTVYDIKEIGGGLKELGLHICLDNIWNKMIANKAQGKRTWIYIDEFYLLMANPSSAEYLAKIWKRARKWAGLPCAITQNVEDMLKSEDARTIINNSSFIMMLTQSPMNRAQLSSLFDLSPEEQKYISTSKPGMGLIRIKDDIIPMNDTFPTHTDLYRIMSTKPDEDL